jgi:hypothetical protein
MVGLRRHLRFRAGRLDVFLVGLAHADDPYRLNPSIYVLGMFHLHGGFSRLPAGRYWRYPGCLRGVKQ